MVRDPATQSPRLSHHDGVSSKPGAKINVPCLLFLSCLMHNNEKRVTEMSVGPWIFSVTYSYYF